MKRNAEGELHKRGFIEAKREGSPRKMLQGPCRAGHFYAHGSYTATCMVAPNDIIGPLSRQSMQAVDALTQVKKELVVMHKVNMENKTATQRTYGALMDGRHMMLICFDASEGWESWKLGMKELNGTFTHSRYALCMLCTPLHRQSCFRCDAPLLSCHTGISKGIGCSTYAMDLKGLLYEAKRKSRDMVLGVQCLMRAFAPELAGASLAQVAADVDPNIVSSWLCAEGSSSSVYP